MTRELIFTATYNESDNVLDWIRGVASNRPEADMLIVDDSSPDGTSSLIEGARAEFPQVTLITRSGKLGLGSAHVAAMQYAEQHGYDVLVTMDADGSHQPCQIAQVVDGLEAADFVIGTRTHGGTHQAILPRRMLSVGANGIARVLLPNGLTEYTTSFRAFNPKAMRSAGYGTYEFGGYAFFIECLEVMRRDGVTMTDRPIDFLDRVGGKSKIPKNQILMSAKALFLLRRRR